MYQFSYVYIVQTANNVSQAKLYLENLNMQIEKYHLVTSKFKNKYDQEFNYQNLQCVTNTQKDDKKLQLSGTYFSEQMFQNLFDQIIPIIQYVCQVLLDLLPIYQSVDQYSIQIIEKLDDILQVFNKNLDNLGCFDKFVQTYDYNQLKFKQLLKKNKNLQNYFQLLKNQSYNTQHIDFLSYYLMPVQFFPRYTLFISGFAKSCHKLKENQNEQPEQTEQQQKLEKQQTIQYEKILSFIDQTNIKLQKASQNINNNIDNIRNLNTLRQIADSIIGGNIDEQLILPQRYFIESTICSKHCRKADKIRKVWLFNDSLMYATVIEDTKFILPKLFLLTGCRAEIVDNQIFISTKLKSFVLEWENKNEANNFFLKLKKQIDIQNESVVTSYTDSQAPIWQQDKLALNCCFCGEKFTVFYRRHHCRVCGRVVCDKCSQGREIVINIDKTKPQRVCDACMIGYQINWKINEKAVEKVEDAIKMFHEVQRINPIK